MVTNKNGDTALDIAAAIERTPLARQIAASMGMVISQLNGSTYVLADGIPAAWYDMFSRRETLRPAHINLQALALAAFKDADGEWPTRADQFKLLVQSDDPALRDRRANVLTINTYDEMVRKGQPLCFYLIWLQ